MAERSNAPVWNTGVLRGTRVQIPLSPPVLYPCSSVGQEYRATNAKVTGSSPVAGAIFAITLHHFFGEVGEWLKPVPC